MFARTSVLAPLLGALALTLLVAPGAALAAANQVDEEQTEGDDDDDRPPPPSVPPVVGLGVGVGATRLADADGLAAYAARSGLGDLSRVPRLVEPSFSLTLDRFVLRARARVAHTASDRGLEVSTLGATAGIGYLALARPDLLLYPSLGVSVVRTDLLAGSSVDEAGTPTFETLARAAGPSPLASTTVAAEATFDVQTRVAGDDARPRGLYLGARVGFTAALAQGVWVLQNRDFADRSSRGPAAPVSGPSLALTLEVRY